MLMELGVEWGLAEWGLAVRGFGGERARSFGGESARSSSLRGHLSPRPHVATLLLFMALGLGLK